MSKLIASGAVQLDADVCNNIDPPVAGCHAGGGIHVTIPGDWQARILAGQQVPGCTYYTLQVQKLVGTLDALVVSNFIESQLGIPAVVNSLPAGAIRGQAAVLLAKLATAQIVP
jgi:hypothetical protein